jgi:phosphoglycerate dehydrogenase-like enzyme
MPDCLIITAVAAEFADEITRLADFPIPVRACTSAEQALAEYSDQTVIFGNPDMIATVLPTMPTVNWVQSSWAGVTPLLQIDYRDYVLTGVKDVFGPQMSEYTMGYLLAHELKVARRLEAQREHSWLRDISGTLAGRRLGIMGTGSIGQHVAKTAGVFGIKVTGLSRSGNAAPGFDKVMPVGQLHEFLAGCDYLLSTLPQTNDTGNLLDAAALARLPEHAYFINVGRSNVVDDDALINALRNGKLAGAALDVFDEEPIPKDSPLWDAPNLSITAHVAAISHPLLIVPIFIDNYRRYKDGQPLKHVIDFATGY